MPQDNTGEELQLKAAIASALMQYESDEVIALLVQQGYDEDLAQQLVEEVEQEETSSPNQNAYNQDVTEQVIPKDDYEERRAQMLKDANIQMNDSIMQDQEDTAYEDNEDQAASEQMMMSQYGGLTQAAYGIELNSLPYQQYNSPGDEDQFITWPTMEADTMSHGGVPRKSDFLKKMTKHLMKAQDGMEQQNQTPSAYGTIDDPDGKNISNKQNFVNAVGNQAKMFQAKQQAEQMYGKMFAEGGADDDWLDHLHMYGESLNHEMMNPQSIDTQQGFMARGGSSRRVRRANMALFGSPMLPPGAKADYEFGPLGGMRRASAEMDMSQMMSILPELAKFGLLPGSPNADPLEIMQYLAKDVQRKMVVKEGLIRDKAVSTINNQSMTEVAAKTNNEVAVKKAEETPKVNTSSIIPKANTTKPTVGTTSKANGTGSSDPSHHNLVPNVVNGIPTVGKPTKPKTVTKVKKQNTTNPYLQIAKSALKMNYPGIKNWPFQEGGFADSSNPELYDFIYGGQDISVPYINQSDEYAEGGDVLPEAATGFEMWQMQNMNPDGTMKNKPSLSGSNQLMTNPYAQRQAPQTGLYTRPNPSMQQNTQPNPQGQQNQMNAQQMQQMQQYMRMMQQQQGQNPFAYGAPRGLGRAALKGLTGFSRDFNYMTGDNPANWNIPEGMTNLRKETFKDRGKRFNPFDTKRVTTYEYSKPGQPSAPGAPGAGKTPAGPGYSGYNADSNGDGMPDYLEFGSNQSTNTTTKPTAGPTAAPNPNESVLGPNGPTALPTPIGPMNQPTTDPNGPAMSNNSPYRSNVQGLEDESRVSVRAGERVGRRNERRLMRQDPNAMYEGPVQEGMTAPMSDEQYMANVNANYPADNFLPTAPRSGTGTGMSSVFGGLEGPGVNTPAANPLVQPNPINQPLYKPGSGSGSGIYNNNEEFAYGGYMADGGYIPDYYTFDGYLPEAGMGIVSDTPEFEGPQDPNSVKYRIEEQSGFSFDPNQLGTNIGLGSNAYSNVVEDVQSADINRAMANKTNYADNMDIAKQYMNRGVTTQEGVEQKTGFESGRTYTGKLGGAKYKSGGSYQSGKTYSLTAKQIQEIRDMGGDVEFI
jgi:hypothetical protein